MAEMKFLRALDHLEGRLIFLETTIIILFLHRKAVPLVFSHTSHISSFANAAGV